MRCAHAVRATLILGAGGIAVLGACTQSVGLPFGVSSFWGSSEEVLTVFDVARPNTCVSLLDASADLAHLTMPAFAVGTRVLLLQAQGTAKAGQWEIARVADIAGTTLVLDHTITGSFLTDGTRSAQICDVPEFATLEVGTDAALAATPWASGAGGVVAVSARSVRIDHGATIDASGAGFAGGVCSDPLPLDTNVGPTDPTTSGYAGAKGEGIDPSSSKRIGSVAEGNAGGGGNANQGGGGGGGNAGAGGAGGYAATEPNSQVAAGGGGIAVPEARPLLLMGGGGGGGQRRINESIDGGYCYGGWGGGIVFVLASSLEGTGTLGARGGVPGLPSPGGGGAGGGAGGTIFLFAHDVRAFGGTLDARGGPGGDAVVGTAGVGGPGGGGGGGRVYAQDALSANVDGGVSGVTSGGGTGAHGAMPGEPGAQATPGAIQ